MVLKLFTAFLDDHLKEITALNDQAYVGGVWSLINLDIQNVDVEQT